MLRFAALVALQLFAVLALNASRTTQTTLVQGIGLAAIVCLAAGALFLFPKQALLITPVLIVIPAAPAYIPAFEWFFLGSLGAYLLRHGSTRLTRLSIRSVDVVFLLYLIWGSLSLKEAVHRPAALLGMMTVLIFFLAFETGSRVFQGRSRFTLFQVYALAAIAVALQEFRLIATRGYSSALLATRIRALTDVGWGVSVYVSAVCVLAACGSLPAGFLGRGRARVLPILAVGAGVFTSLACLARGSILSLFVALVVCTLFLPRRSRALALLSIGGVAAVYLVSPMGQASLHRFTSSEGLPSVGVRLLIYREAVRIALAHPIFGVAPAQMQFHSYFYTGENPHNIFLKNAVDFGLVGLVLYLILLGWVARRWVRLHRRAVGRAEKARSLGIIVLLLTALANASIEPTLGGSQYGFLFWFLIGSLTSPDEPSGDADERSRRET